MEQEALGTARQREKDTLILFGQISEHKDDEIAVHVSRIGIYTGLFFRLLGRDADEAELYSAGTPMHDTGKIGIPEAILQRPGKLDSEEWDLMKTHATLGYELLRNNEGRYFAI